MVLILVVLGCIAVAVAAGHVRSTSVRGVAGIAALADLLLLLGLIALRPELSGDSLTWHSLAVKAGEYLSGLADEPVGYVSGKEGYIWIVGAIYALSGPVPMAAIVLGIICHCLLVVSVARTAEIVVEETLLEAAAVRALVKRAAFMAALTPIFVWWAPHVLRESLTLLLVSASICFTLLAIARRRVWPILVSAASILILAWVRSSLAITVGIALVVGILFALSGRGKYSSLLRAILCVSTVILLPVSQRMLMKVLGLSEERIAAGTGELSAIAASGFPGLSFDSSLPDILRITAPRVLLGPFPWEISTSPVMLLAVTELASWAVFGVLSIRGVVRVRSLAVLAPARWSATILAVVALAVLFGLMFSVGNYGILARFRPISAMILIPLATIGSLSLPLPMPERAWSDWDLNEVER